jgi:hypothetical protein
MGFRNLNYTFHLESCDDFAEVWMPPSIKIMFYFFIYQIIF